MWLHSRFFLNLLVGASLGVISGIYIFDPMVKAIKKEQDLAESSAKTITNRDALK